MKKDEKAQEWLSFEEKNLKEGVWKKFGKKNLAERKRFWDEYSEKYEHSMHIRKNNPLVEKINHVHLKLVEKTLEYVENQKQPRVLKTDLWNETVEPKRSVLTKLPKNLKIHALELSPRLCEKAKKNLGKETKIRCADLKKTGFPINFFDAVFDISTIDHLPPDETSLVIKEICRITKPSGAYLLVFDNPGIIWKTILWVYNKVAKRHVFISYILGKKNVKKILKQNGFEIKQEYATDDWSFLLDIANRLGLENIVHKIPFFPSLISLCQKIELSRLSNLFSFFSRQYAIISVKKQPEGKKT